MRPTTCAPKILNGTRRCSLRLPTSAPALIALFAFPLRRVARVRSLVSEPMPGEIRLQWWRDTLSGTAHGAIEANPLGRGAVAVPSRATRSLPVAPLLAALDARTFDLYDDAMPIDRQTTKAMPERVWSGPMSLSAASVLSGNSPAHFADVAGHGGVALGVARTLVGFSSMGGAGGSAFAGRSHGKSMALDRDMFASAA
jgi:phytoene synthase